MKGILFFLAETPEFSLPSPLSSLPPARRLLNSMQTKDTGDHIGQVGFVRFVSTVAPEQLDRLQGKDGGSFCSGSLFCQQVHRNFDLVH